MQIFKDSYKFVDDIKSKELNELKKRLKDEDDPEEISKLKYLIQRMVIYFEFIYLTLFLTLKLLQENQAREKKKVAKEREAKNEERKQNRELAKEGKAPVFMSKTDRKKKDLVDKFEELKSTGKIDQYLKKKAKKNMIKDRKKL